MLRSIVEERSQNLVVMDVFSKLIQDRIIFIDDIIDSELANNVIAQLLILNSLSKTETINIYINSPGGSCTDGLAIYDIAKVIQAPIRTTCVGTAASMAAVLMFMGKERCALKHSRMMFHEVSGGFDGKTKDMEIYFKVMKEVQSELFDIISENSQITNPEELFKLDTWYTASAAKELGIIDTIL